MFSWLIDQIQLIDVRTFLVTVITSSSFNFIVDWIKSRNLQNQKAAIDRDLELTKLKYQQEIQTDYLKIQLKATTLYKIYPELHGAFKDVEGAIFQLFNGSITNEQSVAKDCIKLTQKLAEHLIFIDIDLAKQCIKAKDLIAQTLQSHQKLSPEDKQLMLNNIHEAIEAITNSMRLKLSAEDSD